MGKIDHRRLSPRQLTAMERELSITVREVTRGADIASFLHDILAQSERVMLARRIRIAKLLISGLTQQEICRELRVGQATVRPIEQWLDSFPDYRKVFPPLYDEHRKRRGSHVSSMQHLSILKTLRQKCPVHVLLFEMLLQD